MPSDENQRRLTANEALSIKRIIWKNFIGGISWAVGSVIGATVVLLLLLRFLHAIDWIPGIGNAAKEVQETIKTAPLKTK